VDKNLINDEGDKRRNHRYKFQSTIRQTEMKKIAEKLSKEAVEKEMKRLSELEAMKRVSKNLTFEINIYLIICFIFKVEEEFQRKREFEKSRIRQQLRSLNERYDK
jgi:hypothetical protein